MEYLASDVEADLTFLWAESEMELDLQYRLGRAGYRSLRKFVGLEDTKPLVRAALITDFNLAAAQDPGNRVRLAAAVSAWEIAVQLLSRESIIRAEAKAEQVSTRRVVERLHVQCHCQKLQVRSTSAPKLKRSSLIAQRLHDLTKSPP